MGVFTHNVLEENLNAQKKYHENITYLIYIQNAAVKGNLINEPYS